jgi:hypothetical protein
MAIVLAKTAYNAPYGLDLTQNRYILHGLFAFASGNYVSGGILPNYNYATYILNSLKDASGQSVLVGKYTQPSTSQITGITVSGTTRTVLTSNPPAAGQFVTLSGFTNALSVPLNGLTVQVATVSAGVSFTATLTTTATTVTDNGLAVLVIGPDTEWIQSISGSGYVYGYNKANATVQIFTVDAAVVSTQYPLIELTAGALPAAVLSDVIEFEAEYARL